MAGGFNTFLKEYVYNYKSALMQLLLLSHSVLSNSFSTPWTVAHQCPLFMGFPSKNTGVGCHFLCQGISPTQGSNLHCWRILDCWATREAHGCCYIAVNVNERIKLLSALSKYKWMNLGVLFTWYDCMELWSVVFCTVTLDLYFRMLELRAPLSNKTFYKTLYWIFYICLCSWLWMQV